MKILLIIVACATSFFIVSVGINYIAGDVVTTKTLVKDIISALVFSVIFVPIMMKSSKKKI